MSLLKVTDLTHGFQEKLLYRSASFALYKGEHIGVVGQNGVGKSTFLRILTGEVVPDQGSIRWQPGIAAGYLDQYAELDGTQTIFDYLRTGFSDLYQLEEEMTRLYDQSAQTGEEALLLRASRYQEQLLEKDFYAVDSKIRRVANGLGLNAIGLERWIGQLSGGQRAKVILAKLLLEEPDVLLLDEPTNFLDKEHVAWLSAYLSAFEGAFLVVSHDFAFLDKIATGICDLEGGTIRKYHGSYHAFVEQKAHLRQEYLRQYQAQQKKIEETEAYIRKNIAGVNTKIAQGRRKQLEKMERMAPPVFTQKPTIRIQSLPLSGQAALKVQKLEVGYDAPILPPLDFTVEIGQKLVVTGFNGIGKSTLLKTLVGLLPALSGACSFSEQVQWGYYEQDLKWEDPANTPFQILEDAYPAMKQREIRQALAQYGVRAEHFSQQVATLSGGEQSKVKLCRLLRRPYNFLILDEPTNHLDAETKAVLAQALREFSGSVILVSHEEQFYRDWADRELNIEACFLKGSRAASPFQAGID